MQPGNLLAELCHLLIVRGHFRLGKLLLQLRRLGLVRLDGLLQPPQGGALFAQGAFPLLALLVEVYLGRGGFGLLGLLLTGQQLTMISMMGFIVLMGTVVNNGIVFVDYANQLRMGGMERRAALIATGKTRMRPILMTTLTTVLAMLQMVFSNDMASQLMSGMAIVIICGLSYATLMTLYIVPILYDILFKKPPLNVDVGSDDDLDDIPDDAAEFIAAQKSAGTAQPEA